MTVRAADRICTHVMEPTSRRTRQPDPDFPHQFVSPQSTSPADRFACSAGVWRTNEERWYHGSDSGRTCRGETPSGRTHTEPRTEFAPLAKQPRTDGTWHLRAVPVREDSIDSLR
jgi:hypothetical protein